MTITLNIRPEVQAALERQAAIQGRAVEAYVVGLLEDAARLPATIEQERAEAIERLVTFGQRHGLSLGGMTIRELRHEARP